MEFRYVRKSRFWGEFFNFMSLGLSTERRAAGSSGINVAVAETEENRLKINP